MSSSICVGVAHHFPYVISCQVLNHRGLFLTLASFLNPPPPLPPLTPTLLAVIAPPLRAERRFVLVLRQTVLWDAQPSGDIKVSLTVFERGN